MTEEYTKEYQLANNLTIRQMMEFIHHHGTTNLADVGGAGFEDRMKIMELKPDVYDISFEELDGTGFVHDICKKPLPKPYKTILCMNTFEHIIDPYSAAQNIIKSLNPGGHVFITTVWSYPFHAYREVIDTYRYTHQALSALFSDLEEVKCWYEDELHPEGAVRVSYIGKKKLL